jgi:hypothetical protein
MTALGEFAAGSYRFIPGPFQYSAGVVAQPGYAIERVRFRRPVALTAGFARIEAHLVARGRPLAAFCACELRSPAPFTEDGFTAFNRIYVGTLERWGLFKDEVNPVARSNVCPAHAPPLEPGFHAFAYTVPVSAAGGPSFITAGNAEAKEGTGPYRDRIVRPGDVSPDGLRAKARFVLAEQERRMSLLGAGWSDTTATQLYTVYDVHGLIADEFAARGALDLGLTWHFARPPVAGLDFEMDVRGVAREFVSD